MEQKWYATWIDNAGRAREITFIGPESRVAAGVDFKLLLLDSGEKIPQHFELEEGAIALRGTI